MPRYTEQHKGKWRAILTALGIDKRYLTGLNGPCPLCPGGVDRFRFTDKGGEGMWICTHCGAGDGIALVMRSKGLGFKEAIAAVDEVAGRIKITAPAKVKQSDQVLRRMLNDIWCEAKPLMIGDPVVNYLKSRAIDMPEWPKALRCHERLKYSERGEDASWHPAMLAKVYDASGKPVQIHRTYLGDRCKANVRAPKKMMPGRVPPGSAVRLGPMAEVMGISTGIETSLSAFLLYGVPVWATLGDAFLMTFVPPKGVKTLIIFSDCDKKFSGQCSAYVLAKSLSEKIEKLDLDIEEIRVETPPDLGTDWNDVLQAERRIHEEKIDAGVSRFS